jgi:hypothetical protein
MVCTMQTRDGVGREVTVTHGVAGFRRHQAITLSLLFLAEIVNFLDRSFCLSCVGLGLDRILRDRALAR